MNDIQVEILHLIHLAVGSSYCIFCNNRTPSKPLVSNIFFRCREMTDLSLSNKSASYWRLSHRVSPSSRASTCWLSPSKIPFRSCSICLFPISIRDPVVAIEIAAQRPYQTCRTEWSAHLPLEFPDDGEITNADFSHGCAREAHSAIPTRPLFRGMVLPPRASCHSELFFHLLHEMLGNASSLLAIRTTVGY